MAIVIGVDVGTSGTKAVAVDRSGQVLATVTVEYPLLTPKPDWAEQNPADWKAAAFEALARLAKTPGIKAADVKGIGLTGQMHGSVFLDGEGKVLRNALLWCDQRTARQVEDITERVGAEQLVEMVNNPMQTSYTAPKILWLRDNEPDVYDKVRKVLLPKDYIRYELTHEYATDCADASGTLLFDVKKRAWHNDLMGLLDIPTDFMPGVCEGPEVTGWLTDKAAKATGLPKGIPVVAGGGDQAAGAVGCGVVKPGLVSATIGTSGVVFAATDTVATDAEGRVQSFCHSAPGKWHVMGVVLSAGGSLRWFRDALCQAEISVAAQTNVDPYAYIGAAAKTAPIGCEGLTFLPYLTGERTPHKDPYARGAFVGLTLRHKRAHMARAVFEGVCYAMRDCIEVFRENNVPINQVRASGGGARSAFWRQMQADVNQIPLTTISVDEGPAYGAALLAMVGTELYKDVDEACEATIRVVDSCQPDPAKKDAYDNWYGLYRETYKALAPGFRRAAELV